MTITALQKPHLLSAFAVALFAAVGLTANAVTSIATDAISFDSSAWTEDIGGPISFSSMPPGFFIIFS